MSGLYQSVIVVTHHLAFDSVFFVYWA